ncbi:MAG: Hpt domain-containing protein, partial [Rhizomicrobium sp.]
MSAQDPREIFRAESQDLLERIEQGLLDLENDPQNAELIASVFRALHTLKGSGAMFGFDALASFTHHCETAFDRVRKGEAMATPGLIAAVLSALDHMRALAEGGKASAEDEAALLAALQMESETPSVPVASPQVAETKTAPHVTAWRIRFRLPPEALVNGTRPLSLLDELRALGQVEATALLDAVPSLSGIVPTDCYLAWDVVLTTDAPRSEIEDVFIFASDDLVLLPAGAPRDVAAAAQTIRVPDAAVAAPVPQAAHLKSDQPTDTQSATA